MSSRFPLQRNSNSFCWSCASTLRSRQQILSPQANCGWRKVTPFLRRWEDCCLIFSSLVSWYILPLSTLLHVHFVFVFPSPLETDPQILEHWGYSEDHWVNYSKRWFSVSNVSLTYDVFSELNTSDWLQYVWALPQNRWRLRRLHILKYETNLSRILQHSHCNFVTIPFWLLARLFVM